MEISGITSGAIEMRHRVDSFLELVVKQKGSDLHLVSGNPPRIRLFGEVATIKYRELSTTETEDLLFEIMPSMARRTFDTEHGVDFGYEIPGMSRFRVNAFRHLGGIGAVFRVIPSQVPSLEEMRLPPICRALCEHQKGLILVTEPTGSGKSTTLAAMVDHI